MSQPRRGAIFVGAVRGARSIALAVLVLQAGQPARLDAITDPRLPSPSHVGMEVVCTGDCNYDGEVGIDDLVKGVNIALGSATPDTCPAMDGDGDCAVRVDELVSAVGNVMHGCPTARFVATDCHVPPPDGQDPTNLMCGDLIVPENRAARNGHTIRLAVEVLKATGAMPAPDPFLTLSGGPGQWAIDSLVPLQTAEFAAPFQSKRDLIFFDQRGTGHSQPDLECPELVQPTDAFAQALTPEQEVERDAASFLACRARLGTEGYDLGAYTSAATAQDIAGLMDALGYQRYNIYSLSYGTRVALTALRDLPGNRIRSVVLDSVAPLQVDLSLGLAAPTADALERMFADCAAESACADAFPNLRQTFFDVVAALNANPPTVETMTPDGQPFTVVLTGDRFVTVLSTALQNLGTTLFLPLLIDGASMGDTDLLSDGASVLADSGTGFQSAGLAATVVCNEEAPFVTTASIEAQNQGVDPRILHAFVNPDVFGRICPQWGSPTPAAVEHQAVTSNVPALVLAGQYDTSTPPAWSQMAAATLSHSTYLEFPGFGHVVIGQEYAPTGPPACATQVIAAFVDDPSHAPSSACVDALRAPAFVTP